MIDLLHSLQRTRYRLMLAVVLPLVLLLSAGAFAAPGAHGPNGEHLDNPAAATSAAATAPRMEAKSEAFELVAHLRDDELSILINRFETNEPVLDAKVEVESGQVKAVAKFHSDLGDYAIDDPAFLKALKAPGAHALVITVVAGADADLLEGTLNTEGAAAGGHSHDDEHGHGVPVIVWIALALLTCGVAIYVLNRGARVRDPIGGAQ
ncbi:hypothetical protein [Variovorax sp. MHTC-1]|uniref:hypothetical protein n=1 Tax=Variovorax sp. MHTC-1 TaxID=2495593 RepID=UPI000F89582C|nr:hypothetical protein [Variovorax sp. MHTC-1]RST47669.1 hypothetical protein EJI01_27730 [Variovorax sp. MHTC-1]